MEERCGFRSGKVIYDREHSTFANHGEDVMEEINAQSGDFFVFTGITLAVNKMIRHQIVDVLKQLKQQGVNIVFDINFRSKLWSKETAVPIIKSILPFDEVLF